MFRLVDREQFTSLVNSHDDARIGRHRSSSTTFLTREARALPCASDLWPGRWPPGVNPANYSVCSLGRGLRVAPFSDAVHCPGRGFSPTATDSLGVPGSRAPLAQVRSPPATAEGRRLRPRSSPGRGSRPFPTATFDPLLLVPRTLHTCRRLPLVLPSSSAPPLVVCCRAAAARVRLRSRTALRPLAASRASADLPPPPGRSVPRPPALSTPAGGRAKPLTGLVVAVTGSLPGGGVCFGGAHGPAIREPLRITRRLEALSCNHSRNRTFDFHHNPSSDHTLGRSVAVLVLTS